MLQYLYFCSHGYYSVCQSVFYELLCNIARHAMKKMKINKNKLFLPRAYFCQTATGNIDIVGLTHAVFVCVCDASLHQFSCLTRDSRPAKCWERRGRKTRWLLIIIQTTLNPSMLMMTMMMTASWRRKMRWLSYCVLMSVDWWRSEVLSCCESCIQSKNVGNDDSCINQSINPGFLKWPK